MDNETLEEQQALTSIALEHAIAMLNLVIATGCSEPFNNEKTIEPVLQLVKGELQRAEGYLHSMKFGPRHSEVANG